MPTTIFGAFRSDSTLSDAGASSSVAGSTFQIFAYNQITIEDGADGTIFDGDDISNETANDPTQTFDDEIIYWDFTVSVTDGTNTYQIGLFDYDINGDGNSIGVDSEDGFFLAFIDGSVPPLNTTLTIIDIIDNGPDIDIDTVVPCFVAGTRIETPDGHRAVETLAVGDAVTTLDHGPQVIRWIGSRDLDSIDLQGKPRLRPIRIARGALGDGLPHNDLCVSPQHRMLVRSPIAVRMFSAQEVLVPAHKLLDLPGVREEADLNAVTYFHMLFDRHEVIFAEGAPTESLYTGPEALKGVGADARAEIEALFPELTSDDHAPQLARPTPDRGGQVRTLVRRHVKNGKPLLAE